VQQHRRAGHVEGRERLRTDAARRAVDAATEPHDDRGQVGDRRQRQVGEVGAAGEAVVRAVDVRAGVADHADPVDGELDPGCVVGAGRLPGQVRGDLGTGQPRVRRHAGGDDVVEVHQSGVAGCGGRRNPARALVLFGHHLAPGDPHPIDHEQAEVGDEQVGETVVGDLGGGQVQPEALGLQAAPVEEGHVGVENGAVFRHAAMLPQSRVQR
jgi:hypothetical protein